MVNKEGEKVSFIGKILHTFGGSVVILMPAWRIEMGKSGCGEELNQSRNAG
jgi:hypothetical protein